MKPVLLALRRLLHSSALRPKRTAEVYVQQAKQFLQEKQLFADLGESESYSKETFLKIIDIYVDRQKLHRRGHIEFLQAAILQLPKYGVERDLEVYKKLFQVFPPGGKIASDSVWQVEFKHYPRQQDTAIELLSLMEKNAVQPDDEVGYMLADIFGQEAHAFSKFQRMMYWMPKLRGSNPWPFPVSGVADRDADLAVFMLKRMCPDPLNEITVLHHTDPALKDILTPEDDFIAWAQSPKQKDLILNHPLSQPVFVEGPWFCFARHKMLNYFVLRSDPPADVDIDKRRFYGKITPPTIDCNFKFMDYFYGKGDTFLSKDVEEAPSLHEQEDGINFAVAITGSSTKSSAATWIRLLQTFGDNKRLADLSIIFRILSTAPPSPDADSEEVEKWLEEPPKQIASPQILLQKAPDLIRS